MTSFRTGYKSRFTVISLDGGALIERLSDGHRLLIRGERLAGIRTASEACQRAVATNKRGEMERADKALDGDLAAFFDFYPEPSAPFFPAEKPVKIRFRR